MSESSELWILSDSMAGPLSRELLGGKGHNLIRLVQSGCRVLRFGIVTAKAFDAWSVSKKLPQAVVDGIDAFAASLPGKEFAVRSSAVTEDAPDASFAGLFETKLCVASANLCEAVIDVFGSARSDRVRAYENRTTRSFGQPSRPFRVAVVIQEMLNPWASGVAFSRKPTGNSALACIESSYGLGQGVVDGSVDVDRFEWDRFGREVSAVIANKPSMVARAPDGGLGDHPVAPERQSLPSLLPDERREIFETMMLIESRFGFPVDIEFALADGLIFILQARPITTRLPLLRHYVDTNLCESYPGRTSRMTQSFVRQIYTQVFLDSARFLGASDARIEQLLPYYRRMIAAFEGHLYYDLNSYCAAMCALPGGQKNLASWHTMIGSRMFVTIPPVRFPPLSWKETARMGRAFFRLFFRHRALTEAFRQTCTQRIRRMRQEVPAGSGALCEKIRYLLAQVGDTRGWAFTLLNDFVVMKTVQRLKEFLAHHGANASLLPGLLRTAQGAESIAPERALRELAQVCGGPSTFRTKVAEILDSNPHLDGSELLQTLKMAGLVAETERIERYLREYGDRSFEELKLESLTFRQSPRAFVELLVWRSSVAGKLPAQSAKPETIRMTGLAAWRLRRYRKAAQRAILARESSRLVRGQYFGWVRDTLLDIGKELFATDPTCVFELSLEELDACARGSVTPDELRALGHSRKAEPREMITYPEAFSHPENDDAEGPATIRPYFVGVQEPGAGDDATVLRGLGASIGRVQGRVLVLLDPKDAIAQERFEDAILVTATTDPGWVFLVSQCQGLISERGSLLSHTAIIGRELQIPTVVGVPGATRALRTGMTVEMDGASGEVRIVAGHTPMMES